MNNNEFMHMLISEGHFRSLMIELGVPEERFEEVSRALTPLQIIIDAEDEKGIPLWRSIGGLAGEDVFKDLTEHPVEFAKKLLFDACGIKTSRIGQVSYTDKEIDSNKLADLLKGNDVIEAGRFFKNNDFKVLYYDPSY